MILSRHQIGLLPADTDADLIETTRAYHDAMAEVERLRGIVNAQKADGGWHAERRRLLASDRKWRFEKDAIVNARDEARAELSALRDRIAALHYGAGDDLGNFCRACGWNYPCATVRLLEGNSDG